MNHLKNPRNKNMWTENKWRMLLEDICTGRVKYFNEITPHTTHCCVCVFHVRMSCFYYVVLGNSEAKEKWTALLGTFHTCIVSAYTDDELYRVWRDVTAEPILAGHCWSRYCSRMTKETEMLATFCVSLDCGQTHRKEEWSSFGLRRHCAKGKLKTHHGT